MVRYVNYSTIIQQSICSILSGVPLPGDPLSATDADNDTLTFRIPQFSINSNLFEINSTGYDNGVAALQIQHDARLDRDVSLIV